jgi:endonuclease V-like protein UPF0215 family
MIKKEIRVIGIDDSPFNKFKDSKVLVVGVVMRGGISIDGILSAKVDVDGSDSTNKIISMINKCKFKTQLQCIFLNGIAVGGFNIIDVKELNKKTKLSVIVVIRRNPNIAEIKRTLVKINKKDKITGQITSEMQKTDNKAEEIVVGEEAKQTNNKINEFPEEFDLNNNFTNNSNNTEENETYYLQLLKNNKSNNISIKKQ